MSDVTRAQIAEVRRRLGEWTGNIPSTEGGGGKGGHSDRTGNLAFRHKIHPDDETRGDLSDVGRRGSDELDEVLSRIIRRHRQGLPVNADIDRLHGLLKRFGPLNEHQMSTLMASGDETGEGWCRSHWRVGALERPRTPGSKLCRWCEDWTRKMGAAGYDVDMPPLNFVEASSRSAPWRELARLLPRGVVE